MIEIKALKIIMEFHEETLPKVKTIKYKRNWQSLLNKAMRLIVCLIFFNTIYKLNVFLL